MIPEIIKITADPAAGAEISYTADEDMIVHSLYVSFVTSAVVANRLISIVADDGNTANMFFMSTSNSVAAASSVPKIGAFEGAFPQAQGGFERRQIPLPNRGLRLRKGDRIRTLTDNLDVGDNYGPMVLQAERTMEGAQ